jgi:hypothetical protein
VTKLREGMLEFDFSAAINAYKFDDPKTHGADTMHKVDFIVEWEKEIWLLEIKDPAANSDPKVRRRYKRTLGARGLDQLAIDSEKLAISYGEKARDSYLYLHLTEYFPEKTRHFMVLVALEGNNRGLEIATRNTKKSCVWAGPFERGWRKSYLEDVQVLNLKSWKILHPQVPIRRIPPTP